MCRQPSPANGSGTVPSSWSTAWRALPHGAGRSELQAMISQRCASTAPATLALETWAMSEELVRTSVPILASRHIAPETTDEHLLELWLHGRSPHTQRAYRADVDRFLAFVARALTTVTLGDVQAFADS